MCIYGYVVMPNHVHLLVSETGHAKLDVAIKSLKQGVSRSLTEGAAAHFWQKRYYDLNIRDRRQLNEKLRYIHRNPVRAGLCDQPGDWRWSSFTHYATGAEELLRSNPTGLPTSASGQWERCAQNKTAPLKPEEGLNGPPASGQFNSSGLLSPPWAIRFFRFKD
jgi:hypothetical protein